MLSYRNCLGVLFLAMGLFACNSEQGFRYGKIDAQDQMIFVDELPGGSGINVTDRVPPTVPTVPGNDPTHPPDGELRCTMMEVRSNGVSSAAAVFLNGMEVFERTFTPDDFRNDTFVERREVSLDLGTNMISVYLRGQPGDSMTVSIFDCAVSPQNLLYAKDFVRENGKPALELDEYDYQ